VADASDLTKTGFTFTGWNTAADGSGTAYQPGDTFTIGSADVTLYAQWEALPQCTLAYEGNGHTSGTPPQNNSVYYAGDGVIVDDQATLLCDNHTFAGWNTAADGSGTTYTPGDVLTMGTVDITLYAQWDDGYYLTYDGNGHTGGAPPGTMWFDPLVHTTPLTVAELGTLEKLQNGILLYFLEWNTQPDGTGTSYAPGDDLTLSGPLTLYAIWQILGGTGPAGGTIFYDKGSYSDGWRYLELAPVSTETTAQWGASGTFLGAYDESIGTGLTNTTLIADSLDSNGETGRAAQICRDLEVGGYDDWFLPSINELWEVFDIKYLGYGDIVLGGVYWSSTESWQQQTEAKALQLNASSATADYPQKTAERYVRAVRRF
jgi:uncharacterized repeat protein (TIGR02543 family)